MWNKNLILSHFAISKPWWFRLFLTKKKKKEKNDKAFVPILFKIISMFCWGCENMILNTMECNICVSLSFYSPENMEPHIMCYNFFFCFVGNLKKSKNGNVLWQFLTIVLAACRTKESRNTKLFNHSFRTFTILTCFPLKILNCFRPDVWRREKKVWIWHDFDI